MDLKEKVKNEVIAARILAKTVNESVQEIFSLFKQSEPVLCKHCDNRKEFHSNATGLCPDRFKHFEAK
jgi:hypothetical protein